jgi:predicted AAA+ superfamily ATPase
MKIQRLQIIEENIRSGRVLVVYGPRRIGKTTALKEYLSKNTTKPTFFSTGDDIKLRNLFSSQNLKDLLSFAKPYEIIAIDEAQQIPFLGLGIKMIIDEYPEKNIILTGSSSFEIAQNIGEPLTGRHFTLTFLPFCQSEINASQFDLKNELENFLIYGSYPEVIKESSKHFKEKILNELVSSYLFKDILAIDNIKSPDTLIKIVKALAFQIGNEVSFTEISKLVQIDIKTVQRYINILEKMFIVKRLTPYSRNLRNEISTKSKYYFVDLGIRNAVISQFNDISSRNDIGALWENFIFMEIYKKSEAKESFENFYFWRTTSGLEIDMVVEKNGKLKGYECKWSNRKSKGVKLFESEYAEQLAKVDVVDRENYLDYLA